MADMRGVLRWTVKLRGLRGLILSALSLYQVGVLTGTTKEILTCSVTYANNGIMSKGDKRTKNENAKKRTRVQKSSGNVFADLAVDEPDEMLAKAQLAHLICKVITDRGLNQTKAAGIMGLDQPKISALMRGKLKGFSADRLFRCLNDLGQEVEITVRPTPRSRRRGNTRVLAIG